MVAAAPKPGQNRGQRPGARPGGQKAGSKPVQRAAPDVYDAIDPGAPAIVGFTSGTTSGAKA